MSDQVLDQDGVLVADRVIGAVLWFREEKGYGFVLFDQVEYFIHFTEILADGFRTLRPGQKVRFTPATGERGLHCKDLEVVS